MKINTISRMPTFIAFSLLVNSFNRCDQTCFISDALSILKKELLSFTPRNKNKIIGRILSITSFMNNHPRRLFFLRAMQKRNVIFLSQLTFTKGIYLLNWYDLNFHDNFSLCRRPSKWFNYLV